MRLVVLLFGLCLRQSRAWTVLLDTQQHLGGMAPAMRRVRHLLNPALFRVTSTALLSEDECEDGGPCHYVSSGGTPVWPSTKAFADSCGASTCPNGRCGLTGNAGGCLGTPRKCRGNGVYGAGGTPEDD